MNCAVFLVWILIFCALLDLGFAKRNSDKQKRSRNDKCQQDIFRVIKKGSEVKGTIADIIDRLCLPPNTDRFVYRFKNDSYIRIDFDVVPDNILYSISWDVKQENPEILYGNNKLRKFKADEIRPNIPAHLLLAATNEGQQRRFLRNLRNCQDSSFISLTCVIQSFSALGRRMQEVSIKKK
ncbi:hypothetical protein ACF0H5_016568 [Mactra antiquata]